MSSFGRRNFTPVEALRELLDMGVDEQRIRHTPFVEWPALYDTVIREVQELLDLLDTNPWDARPTG